jgi:hypothetical protein
LLRNKKQLQVLVKKKGTIKLGIVVHTYNTSTQKADAGRSQIQSQSGLLREISGRKERKEGREGGRNRGNVERRDRRRKEGEKKEHSNK